MNVGKVFIEKAKKRKMLLATIMIMAVGIITLIVITLSSFRMDVVSQIPTEDVASQIPKEEYEIFSIIISEDTNNRKPRVIRIIDHTTNMALDRQLIECLNLIPEELVSLHVDLIQDFEAKNQRQHALQSLFNLPQKIYLIDEGKTSYQNDILLSRVGFNTQGDIALVYMEYYGGFLWGRGDFFLLRKDNGSWKIESRVMVWIS